MKKILNNWHWMRILRLGIGAYGLIDGIQRTEILMIVLGALFVIQAIFNWGCSNCTAGNCQVDTNKLNKNEKLDT